MLMPVTFFIILYQFCFSVCSTETNIPQTLWKRLSPVCATIPVRVKVNPSTVVFNVDSRFYSIGQGASLSFVFRHNLSNPVLKLFAKELAPAYFRVGGTKSNFLVFCDDEKVCEDGPGYSNITFSGKVWDEINTFVKDAGWNLVFTVNAFLRTPDNKWDPSNLIKLLEYSSKRGYKLDFELGNEPNAYFHKFNKTITPEQNAEDFKSFKAILKQYNNYQDSLLIGPDVTAMVKYETYKPLLGMKADKYLSSFLDNVGDTIDVTSSHFYYCDHKDPVMPSNFTSLQILDIFSRNAKTLRRVVHQHRPSGKYRTWIGESGDVAGGGLKNFSDRFASGMVWLDKLGIGALSDIEVFIREVFLDDGRGLIDPDIFPHVDYWSAVLFRRLVGKETLKVSYAQSTLELKRLRLYAHCTRTAGSPYHYQPGAVTIFGVNFNKEEAVELLLDVGDIDQFLLTPVRPNNILSRYGALNGVELALNNGSFPELSPQPVVGNPIMPQGSMGFFVLKNADFKICKS